MAFTNFETKEINCKIIYFGPKGSGKTENLRSLLKQTSQELKAGLVEIAPQDQSIKFFDFLPISLGKMNGFHVKLHLFSLPDVATLQPLTTVLMKGLDGIVFVADSRAEALSANQEAMSQMQRLLIQEGYDFSDIPKVIQYNKQDHADALAKDVLSDTLNQKYAAEHEAAAVLGKGTLETLESMAKQVIEKMKAN